LGDICWKVDRFGTTFHDCSTDNTILLVGLILFHEFEATLQVTTDSYWFLSLFFFFFFFAFPFGSRPLAHEHKCEVKLSDLIINFKCNTFLLLDHDTYQCWMVMWFVRWLSGLLLQHQTIDPKTDIYHVYFTFEMDQTYFVWLTHVRCSYCHRKNHILF
jgi:hypothetical protein